MNRPLTQRLFAAAPVRPGETTYVAIIEIDRFQKLRRLIGFEMASEILDEVSARVTGRIEGGSVGRIGRTTIEFMFSAPSAAAAASLQRLLPRLQDRYHVGRHGFDLTFSIGAAEVQDAIGDEVALDAAAAALIDAKQQRLRIKIDAGDDAEDDRYQELPLMRDLRDAIAADALDLHYQAKLNTRSDRIASAEGLLRWRHRTHGPIRTDRLIEIAEETGAIRDLTRWCVNRALIDHAKLDRAGYPITLFVNISGLLLSDDEFVAWLLDRASALPEAIGLEVTETAVIEDPARAIANLQAFASAGIKIAIDDYGSGLSSLAYLKQLPAHELKIDRMFVSGLAESHRDPLLVRSSIDLAHALEMEVTAEGVDDPVTLALLRIMGCDNVQGYLISHPLPLHDFIELLKRPGGPIVPDASGHEMLDAIAELRRQATEG